MQNITAIMKLLCLLVLEVGLASGFNVSYSILSPNCGNVLGVEYLRRSMALEPYEMNIEKKPAFVFEVKAMKGARIYMTDLPNSILSNNSYIYTIGSYSNTGIMFEEIRNGQESEEIIQLGSYLNSSLFKPFWCSWENGDITVGQGNIVGQNTLMSWTDPNPFSVAGIGIGTCWGGTGEWKVKVEVEDDFAGHFSNCKRRNTTSGLPIIASYVVSEFSCAEHCAMEKSCFGFNYQPTNKRCELVSYGDEPVTTIMRRELEGWDFYVKCYDGCTGCVGCSF